MFSLEFTSAGWAHPRNYFETYFPHFWSDDFSYQVILMIVFVFTLLMQLTGVRTKLAIALNLLLFCSMNVRTYLGSDGADSLLSLILLALLVLPDTGQFSLNGKSKKPVISTTSYSSYASAGVMLLFVHYYFSAGFSKINQYWFLDKNALELALGESYWVRPAGHFLLSYPAFLKNLAPFVPTFEMLAPLILVWSAMNSPIRYTMILIFLVFQIILGSLIELNLMPWISTAFLVIFLPSRAFDYISKTESNKASGSSGKVKIYEIVFVVAVALSALGSLGLGTEKVFSFLHLNYLGFGVGWKMYSNPPLADVKFQFLAKLESGKTIDLNEVQSWSSSDKSAFLENYRFRYSLQRLDRPQKSKRLLRWLGKRWMQDQRNLLKIVELQLVKSVWPISAKDLISAKPVREVLATHSFL